MNVAKCLILMLGWMNIRRCARNDVWIAFLVMIFEILQGWPPFFPPPNFPICQNGEEQQSPELATPSNDRVQNLPPSKNGRVQNLPPLNSPKFWTLPIFGCGKFWTLSFQRVAQFRFFSILAHREIRGGGREWRSILYHFKLWLHTALLSTAVLAKVASSCVN